MIDRVKAINEVLWFLNKNYPCDCGDTDCPVNYFEAEEIVSIVLGE